jgi:flagellar motility protein MotE (MotC chaperone)
MNRKFIVAILLIAAVPVCAHAQNPKVSKDDAQKVVTIISGDKAKTQTYCDIQKLGEQMRQAYEKKNLKLVDELSEKIETLEETLGPEYAALIDGLEQLDPENDKLGTEIMMEFAALNRLCAR